MEANLRNEGVLSQCCEVLADLVKHDQYRVVVYANKGAEACFSVLTACPNDPDIAESCLNILKELVQIGSGQRRRLVDAGVLQSLAQVAARHTAIEPVMAGIASILQFLSGDLLQLCVPCDAAPAPRPLTQAVYRVVGFVLRLQRLKRRRSAF